MAVRQCQVLANGLYCVRCCSGLVISYEFLCTFQFKMFRVAAEVIAAGMNNIVISGYCLLVGNAPCHSVCHCHYTLVVCDSDSTNHAIVLFVFGSLPDMTAMAVWLQSSPILVHVDQQVCLLRVALSA
jgi:hypothetical protein